MRWPSVGLGEICKPKQWKNISTNDFTTSGYPVYGANGKIGFFHEFTHEEPVILVACRGATCGAINVTEPYSYANSNAMALDSIDTTKIDLRYLAKYLEYRGFQDVVSGSAQPQITSANIAKVEVLLPPLEEQRRIAAILDKASRIAELCGTALKLSHAADKSLFLHFFADLSEESDLLLEELADKRSNAIRTGPLGSQLLHGEFTDSGVAVLGIDNAVNNSFEWSKRRFISHLISNKAPHTLAAPPPSL